MQCPKCYGDMTTVLHGDVRVERCNRCCGMYFDQLTREDVRLVEDLVELDTGDEALGAEFNETVYVECPKCDRIMDQRLIEEPVYIRFEVCPTCHSGFLDAGEFRQYLAPTHRPYFDALLPEEH